VIVGDLSEQREQWLERGQSACPEVRDEPADAAGAPARAVFAG
jgi:hypothetical protein